MADLCVGFNVQVLSCLTEKRDQIKLEACRKELLYLEKMEVNCGPRL